MRMTGGLLINDGLWNNEFDDAERELEFCALPK